jgi:hypothetical protein
MALEKLVRQMPQTLGIKHLTGETKMRTLIAIVITLTFISGAIAESCPSSKPNHRKIIKYTQETLCSKKPCTGRIICMDDPNATCYRENCIPCKQSTTEDICLTDKELKDANRK